MILGNLFDHIWTTFRDNDLRTEIKIERPAKNTFSELKYPKTGKQFCYSPNWRTNTFSKCPPSPFSTTTSRRRAKFATTRSIVGSSHTVEELEAAIREEVLRIDESTMDLVVANFARRLDVVVEKGDGGHFENVFVR